MRTGVRLGVDVGTVRIGLARSDPHGVLALPVVTVPRGSGDVAEIVRQSSEFDAMEIIVGLPLAMSGGDSASTRDARDFAARLATAVPGIDVRLVDERLTTVSAHQVLRASGRSSRSSRPVIDQVAAVIILQHALDGERSGGNRPGTLVATDQRDPDHGG